MASLHNVLLRTDGTHEGITRGAAEMMRHYDHTAETAVTEWRNALQACRVDQLLPLLYVANEVLQNSKRNRGNKFLAAFAENNLAQSLQLICQRSPDLVEKVRRTSKIWGDRRVFSGRYVGELLRGLEPYRNSGNAAAVAVAAKLQAAQQQQQLQLSQDEAGRFSPLQDESGGSGVSKSPAEVTRSPSTDDLFDADDDDDDDKGGGGGDDLPNSQLTNDTGATNTDDDDDDDDSLGFIGDGENQLDFSIDADALLTQSQDTQNASSPSKANGNDSSFGKRKRATGTAKLFGATKRRRTVLSTQSLQDIWNQLSVLQKSFDKSLTAIRSIPPVYFTEDNIQDLVGEELLDAHKRIVQYQKVVGLTERKNIHRVAVERHALEQEATRYLPWLEAALQQDDEEVEFCDKVETQLRKLQPVLAAAQQARNERVQKDMESKRKEEIRRREEQAKAEREASLEKALTKQDEAKPGMVWNKSLQEYVYLNTSEDWRD